MKHLLPLAFLFIATFNVLQAQMPQVIVEQYGLKQGLPHEVCYDLMEGIDGQIYVGTDDGLAIFDGDDFRVIGKSQGLSNQYVIDVYQYTPDTILLGTWGGGVMALVDGVVKPFPILAINKVSQIDSNDSLLFIHANTSATAIERTSRNFHVHSPTRGLSSKILYGAIDVSDILTPDGIPYVESQKRRGEQNIRRQTKQLETCR